MPRNAKTAAQPADPATPELAFARSELGQSLLRLQSEGSASSRAIADYLLRNPLRLTALGIEELADGCAVSTATVSRFAREIGFPNFSAMRSAVADILQLALQPVDKLRASIEQRHRSGMPGMESLEFAAANVAATTQSLSPTKLAAVVRAIGEAGTVYVMGFGLSSHLAGLLALHLQPFCASVVEVVTAGGNEVAAGRLMNIGPADVLVAISFPRYAVDAVGLSGFARDRGACVVAVTDAPASPLAKVATHSLYAACAHPVLSSSACGALAVIEAVVAGLMVSNEKNVKKAALLTEMIASYLVGDAHGAPAGSGRSRKARTAD